MKIILIIPTLKQGGAERVMSSLANKWAEDGHDVNLVLLVKANYFYELGSNIKIHQLDFNYSGKLSRVFSEIKTLLKLRKTIKKISPVFVLSFMTKYNILTILATAFLKTPIYISERNNPNFKLPKGITFLRKRLYRYATGIIAQTRLAKQILEDATENKNIKVFPNPLTPFSVNENISKEKVILNVGRLVEEKGQTYLIEAFSRIQSLEWKLVILGEGPLRETLEKKIVECNVSHRVELKGAVSNVDEWLQKSSIFAFSSISEGFPNALVEAMSFGLPCVAFDCDAGPRDIIVNGDNGFLVELKNTTKFSNKLDLLIKDENLREKMSHKAKAIKQKLDSNKIAKDILSFCSQSTVYENRS